MKLFPSGPRLLRHERRVISAPQASRLVMRVVDDAGRPLTEEFALGSRDGARRRAELSFSAPVDVSAWVEPVPGPEPGRGHLAVRGDVTLTRGLSLQISARPAAGAPANPLPAPPRVRLAGPGTTFHATEHTLEKGCPADAWVSASLVDAAGREFSGRQILGRYVLP